MSDATFQVHGQAAVKPGSRSPRRPSSPVTVIRVDPAAWRHALQLCDGDATRITVLSATEIVISNNSGRPTSRAQQAAARR